MKHNIYYTELHPRTRTESVKSVFSYETEAYRLSKVYLMRYLKL